MKASEDAVFPAAFFLCNDGKPANNIFLAAEEISPSGAPNMEAAHPRNMHVFRKDVLGTLEPPTCLQMDISPSHFMEG